MKFALAPLAAALFVSGALAQFTINTPTNVVVCQPILLTWTGGTPPYFLSVHPGDQPGAAALEDLGQQTGTSFTWLVDIAAGTSVGLSLRDTSGQTVQTASFPINPGSDTSCVGKGNSASGSAPPSTGTGSSSGSGSSTGGSSTPASTTPSAPTTTPSTPATTPPTTTSGTSSASRPNASTTGTPAPSSSNAASVNSVHFGAAGIIGAAAIALLA